MNCIRCGAEMNSATGGNYTCPKCGMRVNDLVYRTQNCDIPLPQGFGMQYGWVCPKCGQVLAPWMGECDCHRATNVTTPTKSVDLSRYYTLINDGMVPDAKL